MKRRTVNQFACTVFASKLADLFPVPRWMASGFLALTFCLSVATSPLQGAEIRFTSEIRNVNEDAGRITLSVFRDGSLEGELTVAFATTEAAAELEQADPELDYVVTTGEVAFQDGQYVAYLTIPIVNDGLLEPVEYFSVELGEIVGDGQLGEMTRTTVHISDNDSETGFKYPGTRYVAERETSIALLVSRGNDGPGIVSVTWETVSGTATEGEDYLGTTGTLEFAETEATKELIIPIINDDLYEHDETFTVWLTDASEGVNLGNWTTKTIVIFSDETAVEFTRDELTVPENVDPISVSVTRGSPGDQAFSIDYVVHELEARSGADFELSSGRLEFPAGTASQTILIPILNDSIREETKSFRIQLTNMIGSAVWGINTNLTVYIEDNDTGVRFDRASSAVSESNGGSEVARLVRGGDGQEPTTVRLRNINGSAVAGEDFREEDYTITLAEFNAGLYTGLSTTDIGVVDDFVKEPNEDFSIEIVSVENGSLAYEPAPLSVTILNDDFGFEFDPVNSNVEETDLEAIVTIRRPLGDPDTHVVEFRTMDDTATAGADYIGTTNFLTFEPGELEKTVSIPIINDAWNESIERIRTELVLVSGPNYEGLQLGGWVSIEDNDRGAHWQVQNHRFQENHGMETLRVSRGNDGTNVFMVSYEAIADTATLGEDYIAESGVLEFAAGEMEKEVDIVILNDALTEGPESFRLDLFDPVGGDLGNTTRFFVFIEDNDPGVRWSNDQLEVAESAGSVTLLVDRGSDDPAPFTVEYYTYRTSGGNAVAGLDYVGATNTIIFAEGQASASVNIPILNDAVFENDEDFYVGLFSSSDGRSITSGTAKIQIRDDDFVEFADTSVSVNENAATITFRVARGADITRGISVGFSTVNNTAMSGEDYVATSGTLVFAPNEREKTITVPILNDSLREPDETFRIELINVTGDAGLGINSIATARIRDNDGVEFTDTSRSVDENGENITFQVRGGEDAPGGFTVDYTTLNESATAGADYMATSGTLVFASGEAQKGITVPILNDGLREERETFRIALSNVTGGTSLGANTIATARIYDNDDSAYVNGEYEIVEDIGETVFRIERGNDGTNLFSVAYTTVEDTAVAGEDYQSASGTVVFEGVERWKEVRVPIVNDGLVEDAESFLLRLTDSNGEGWLDGTPERDVRIIDNDTGIAFGSDLYRIWEDAGVAILIVDRGSDETTPVSVSWKTEDVSAVNGVDYFGGSGTLTFSGAERCQRIVIPLAADDYDVESIKTFRIELTTDDVSLLGERSLATVQIDDNDTCVVYAGNLRVDGEDEVVSLLVTREHALNESVTIAWNTADDSALAGQDYAANSGVITFAPGEPTGRIEIALIQSANPAVDVSFNVHLAEMTGAADVLSPISRITIDRSRDGGVPPDRVIGFGEHYGTDVTDDGSIMVTGSSTGLQVWDLQTGQLIRVIGNAQTTDPKISPNQQWVAATSEGAVKIWNLDSGVLHQTLVTPGGQIDFSPDGRYLAIGTGQGTITLWDLGNPLPRRTQPDRIYGIGHAEDQKFFVNGADIAIGNSGAGAILWDLKTGAVEMAMGHGSLYPLAASPDGGTVLLRGDDRTEVWNLEKALRLTTLPHENLGAVADGGGRVALASSGDIRVIDTATGNEVWSNSFKYDVRRVALSPDGNQLVFTVEERDEDSGQYETLKLVQLNDLSLTDLSPRVDQSHDLEFSQDGTKFFSAVREQSGNESVIAYDLETGVQRWSRNYYWSHDLAPSPDGQSLAFRAESDAVVLDASTGSEKAMWNDSSRPLAFSADSATIFDSDDSALLRAWSAETDTIGERLFERPWLTGLLEIRQMRFASSGNQLLLGGYGSARAQLVETATGDVLWETRGNDPPRALSGDFFAFTRDATIRLRDVNDGAWLPPMQIENTDGIQELEFSPDGSTVALKYWENTSINGGSSEETIDIRSLFGGPSLGQIIGRQSQNIRPSWMNTATRQVLLERNGHLTLFNYESNEALSTVTGFRRPESMSVSPDGSRMMAVHFTGGRESRPSSVIWDLETGSPLTGYNGRSKINRDWNLLVVDEDNKPDWSIHDPATLAHLHTIVPPQDQWIEDVVPSPDGSTLLGQGEYDGHRRVWLWEAGVGGLLREWSFTDNDDVRAIGYAPDSQRILIGMQKSGGSCYQLIDLISGGTLTLPVTDNAGDAFEFSPNGEYLATGEEHLELWDAQTAGLIAIVPDAGVYGPSELCFTADSTSLLYSTEWRDESADKTRYDTVVLDSRTGAVQQVIQTDRDGRNLATGTDTWLIGGSVHDSAGQFLETIKTNIESGGRRGGTAGGSALSPDGRTAFLIHDGRIGIWDLNYLFRHRVRLMSTQDGLHLDWQEGTLQLAPTLNGPWYDLPTVRPPWRMPTGGAEGYFRIKGER